MPAAVGIGLTNECNLACPHCYRPTVTRQRLSLAQVATLLVSGQRQHPRHRRIDHAGLVG